MGNIYLGGTGKTPTSILIANEIKNNGKKVAILRKFYKTHKDEHNLIRNSFSNLILSHKRVEGIIEAEKLNYDVVILDDVVIRKFKLLSFVFKYSIIGIILLNSPMLAA